MSSGDVDLRAGAEVGVGTNVAAEIHRRGLRVMPVEVDVHRDFLGHRVVVGRDDQRREDVVQSRHEALDGVEPLRHRAILRGSEPRLCHDGIVGGGGFQLERIGGLTVLEREAEAAVGSDEEFNLRGKCRLLL